MPPRRRPAHRFRRALAGAVTVAALAPAAAGADPVGEPFAVEGFVRATLAYNDASGRFLMAGCDSTGEGMTAFFDPSGDVTAASAFPDPQRRYDTCPDGAATNPKTGDQLVTYTKDGVHAVLLGPDGRVDEEVAVAPRGEDAAVAFDPRLEEFFVAWADRGVIRGKRVSATGEPLGSGVSRVSDRTGENAKPDVAARPGAGWLVVWQTGTGASADVVAQAVAPSGSDTGTDDARVSSHRNLAGLSHNVDPAVAYDPRRREALVVFSDGFEIFGQRLSASGSRIAGNARLSRMGPDGDPRFRAREASVAYHPRAREYLVVWIGNDRPRRWYRRSQGDEVFAQHVSATGSQLGEDDARLSLEPEKDLTYRTDVAADPRSREYVATWTDCCDDGATNGATVRRVLAP